MLFSGTERNQNNRRGGGRQKSYQEVCAQLNVERVKTLQGGQWSPQLIRALFYKAGATKAKKFIGFDYKSFNLQHLMLRYNGILNNLYPPHQSL